MALRKEQVLLLAVLALGFLQYRSMQGDGWLGARFDPQKEQYQPTAVPRVALAGTADELRVRRDFFREPSETQPLPPTELPFPGREPLTVVPLPLLPGVDLSHAQLLRMPAGMVEGVSLPDAADTTAAPTDGGGDDPAVQDPGKKDWQYWARTYDQIGMAGLGVPFVGIIVDHPDKYALAATRDFSGVKVRMRVFSTKRERLEGVVEFGSETQPIERVGLARTLRNEVEQQRRSVPEHAGNLSDRSQLIDWLLEKARQEAWVYGVALDQADLFLELSNNDLEGYRHKVRVLRARGDLAAEFALYQGLSGRLAQSAFRYEGLGTVKARLGLFEDAEADLRQAVEVSAGDPRPLASLAEFLLERGRAAQAVAVAERALQGLLLVTSTVEQARVLSVVTHCRLAVGDPQGARDALVTGGNGHGQAMGLALSLLPGAIDYAAGNLDTALQAFRTASTAGAGPDALLGAGACLLRLGEWREAQAAFLAVADQAPLLRSRAWSGLGLLHFKTGQREQALQWLDRALEADPREPYAHYLRGRVLRELGQLPQALEAFHSALRLRDDFLHALCEMAMTHRAMAAESRGREGAVHLASAVRYIDRTVALEGRPSLEFLELQGLLRFEATDVYGAEQAFAMARDAATDNETRLYGRVALALCEYARGRTDEARLQLQRVGDDLPLGHGMRQFGEATLRIIDDHSQKERLEDGFERSEIGAIWKVERDGDLAPQVVGGRVQVKGRFSRAAEVSAERSGAVQKAGRFLALQIKMQTGSGHRREGSFAGLRLETAARQGQGQGDFRVQIGFQDGQPWLRIEDGRSNDPTKEQEREPVRNFGGLIPGFDPLGEQTLELRVQPRDEQGRLFRLSCLWNGAVVHERDLAALRSDTSTELRALLVVSGARQSTADVFFDDYRLERRKENP